MVDHPHDNEADAGSGANGDRHRGSDAPEPPSFPRLNFSPQSAATEDDDESDGIDDLAPTEDDDESEGIDDFAPSSAVGGSPHAVADSAPTEPIDLPAASASAPVREPRSAAPAGPPTPPSYALRPEAEHPTPYFASDEEPLAPDAPGPWDGAPSTDRWSSRHGGTGEADDRFRATDAAEPSGPGSTDREDSAAAEAPDSPPEPPIESHGLAALLGYGRPSPAAATPPPRNPLWETASIPPIGVDPGTVSANPAARLAAHVSAAPAASGPDAVTDEIPIVVAGVAAESGAPTDAGVAPAEQTRPDAGAAEAEPDRPEPDRSEAAPNSDADTSTRAVDMAAILRESATSPTPILPPAALVAPAATPIGGIDDTAVGAGGWDVPTQAIPVVDDATTTSVARAGAPVRADQAETTTRDVVETPPAAEPRTEPIGTHPTSGGQRLLLVLAIIVAAVLVLIGLFALGTRIPAIFGSSSSSPTPAQTPRSTPAPTPTPAPTITPKPAGAQGAGVHPWYTLGGGECVSPFTSTFASSFTVVDCAGSHAAQLLYTDVLNGDITAAWPGDAAVQTAVVGLCGRAGIVNPQAAGRYSDLQLEYAYPATKQQWDAGQRSYYCFVARSSGQPITGSVAGSGPTT